MKIVLFIDSLTSGGAQRQLCSLARLLQSDGHNVSVLVYYPLNFFESELLSNPKIPIHKIQWKGQCERFFGVRKFVCSEKPDIIISFLYVPCFLAELVRLVSPHRFKLIASERNHNTGATKRNDWIRLGFHSLSSVVVANSHVQAHWLFRHAPWLRKKIQVITNCVDLEHFKPNASKEELREGSVLNMVVVGRYEAQKNGLALIEALARYNAERGELPRIQVDWYGNDSDPASGLLVTMRERIGALNLEGLLRLHAPSEDIVSVYHEADALCLVSLHEGCANVVCEAMACGIPAIVTDAGDNKYLLGNGASGIMASGTDPTSIFDALKRFALMSFGDRIEMGRQARRRAEELLSTQRFLREWSSLLG